MLNLKIIKFKEHDVAGNHTLNSRILPIGGVRFHIFDYRHEVNNEKERLAEQDAGVRRRYVQMGGERDKRNS